MVEAQERMGRGQETGTIGAREVTEVREERVREREREHEQF